VAVASATLPGGCVALAADAAARMSEASRTLSAGRRAGTVTTGNASVWSKVGQGPRRPKPGAGPPRKDQEGSGSGGGKVTIKEHIRRLRRRAIVADVVGILVWSYLVIKVFVFDVDRAIAERVGSTALKILDFRLLIFLGLIAAMLLLLRQKKAFWILYVLFYPLVFLFFHVPLWLQKAGSWLPAIAIANLAYNVANNFRRVFALRVLELSAGVLIIALPGMSLTYALAAVIATAMLRTYWQVIRNALQPIKFLRTQVSWVGRVLRSPATINLASLPDDLKKSRARRFNDAQIEKFTNSLGNALIAVKAANLYAYQLERYRKSSIPFALSFLSFAGLYVYSIVALAIINLAVYKTDPSQYAAAQPPSFLTFVHYSLSALFVNGIDALSPVRALALLIQIASGVIGPLLLMTLAVTAVTSFKQTREGEGLQEALTDIKQSAMTLNNFMSVEYEVSPEEALRRLEELGAATAGLVALLASRIPSDFDDYFKPD
jgi:hypothetical protein